MNLSRQDVAKPVNPSDANGFSVPQVGKLDSIVGRIDLVAILITFLGVVVLGLATMAMSVWELVRWLPSLWSEPFNRWLIIGLGATVAWVAARWKRLRLF